MLLGWVQPVIEVLESSSGRPSAGPLPMPMAPNDGALSGHPHLNRHRKPSRPRVVRPRATKNENAELAKADSAFFVCGQACGQWRRTHKGGPRILWEALSSCSTHRSNDVPSGRPVPFRDKWRIRWLDHDSKRQSALFDGYVEAERELRKRQALPRRCTRRCKMKSRRRGGPAVGAGEPNASDGPCVSLAIAREGGGRV